MGREDYVVKNSDALSQGKFKYEITKLCPSCTNQPMKYIYGETYECPCCGRKELSDFGKVREFLNESGPQPALIISAETGVKINVIEQFLREGRVEIPDGSSIYIKCQICGTDIRYGRYCPDCIMKTTKNLSKAMLSPEVGEKPRHVDGKMHFFRGDEKNKMKRH